MNRQEELVSIAKQTIVLNDAVDSQGDTVLGAMVDSGELSEVEYLEVCSIMLDMKSHNTPNEVVPEEGEINVDGGNNFMMPHPGWEDKVVTDVESETDKPVPDKESEGDGNFNYTKPRKRQVIHNPKEEKKDENHEN